MAHIEGIHIKNFRSLKNVSLGKTSQNDWRAKPLPKLITMIGPNGCGKSTFMDIFEFIHDCLTVGVEEAGDKPHRGGFERLHTRGQRGSLKFEINYRIDTTPLTYVIEIDKDNKGRPIVIQERLVENAPSGSPVFWRDENAYILPFQTSNDGTCKTIEVKLKGSQRLGISTLGNLAEHPPIVALRELLDNWYLSYFVPDLARRLPVAGAQKHLNRTGGNLANYMQFIQTQSPQGFDEVLRQITAKIPGIKKITVKKRRIEDCCCNLMIAATLIHSMLKTCQMAP